jgi:hypothetical protein
MKCEISSIFYAENLAAQSEKMIFHYQNLTTLSLIKKKHENRFKRKRESCQR